MEYPRGKNLAIVVLLMATIVPAGKSEAQVTLGEHRFGVSYVLFSPDGTSLISLSEDDIKIWDTATNNMIVEASLSPLLHNVNSVIISPDGEMLAFDSSLWHIENREIIERLGRSVILAARFSSDGKTVKFLTRDLTILTWDVEKRELISTVSLSEGVDVPQGGAISPDGKLAAAIGRDTGAGSEMKIWNTETGVHFHTLQLPPQSLFALPGMRLLAFSSAGVLAYVTGSDINLWDVEKEEAIATLEGKRSESSLMFKSVTAIAFSPDGERFAAGVSGGSLNLWNVENQETVFIADNHEDDIATLAFSSDGSKIASGGGRSDRKVILWDIASVIQKKEEEEADRRRNVALLLGHHTRYDITSVAFSPVENILASGARDGAVMLWNTEYPSAKPIVLTDTGFEIMSVAFSVDGKVLASGSEDNTFSLWDVASKERIANVFGAGRGEINSVSFSPDGKLLATGRDNNRIEIWDADIRTYSQIEGATASSLAILGEYDRGLDVEAVTFADGKILGALYDDGNVKVWNIESKTVVETIDLPEHIFAIASTPDGKTLVMGSSGDVSFWDKESRQVSVWEIEEMGDMPIRSIAVSHDGLRLATSGSQYRETKTKVWEIATRDSITLPAGLPEGDVYSLAFSPNGQRLAMGLEDGVVVLCNISEDAPPLTGGTPPPSPDFDGDGTVGFGDFLLFAAAFGRSEGDAGFDARFDLDGNGAIGFSDFLIFAGAFGKSTS